MSQPKEATITINGRTLSYAEALALRVAVSTMITDFTGDPDALGTDDHGRTMVQNYLRSLHSIQNTIFEEIG